MPITEAPYTFVNGEKQLAPKFLKYDNRAKFTWEPVREFDATIEILASHGSVVSVVDVHTNVHYWILSSYLLELIHLDVIKNSRVIGKWKIYKHGQSYGIKLA